MRFAIHRMAALVLCALTALGAHAADAPPATDTLASPHYGNWGFDTAGMDRSARPGDDFYRYANGAWVDRTVIPPDAVRTGYFIGLNVLAAQRTRALVEAAAADPAAAGDRARVGALYRAFMDADRIEARGAAPLHADLDALRGIDSLTAFAAYAGRHASGFGIAPFSVEFEKDTKAPTRYAVYLHQGGLGLPSRDYYLLDQFAEQRRAYQAYIARMLDLSGWSSSPQVAAQVFALETRIAQASWTLEQERDPVNGYKSVTQTGLATSAPGFPWQAYFGALGLDANQPLVAATDTSIVKIAAIVKDTPLDTLKAWEAFHMTDGAAQYLPQAFADAYFGLHSTAILGQPKQPDRWKRGITLVNDALGAAVGKLYVQAYLNDATVHQMHDLTDNLQTALRERIQGLSWMSADSKAEALRKLANFEVQIGAPKVDRDYSSLTVRPDDLYGDVARAKDFEWQRQLTALHGPWDKSAWRFWPQYATAYNENGQLIFTAGMLQAPFFDAGADAAINYGAMGAVIGHELSHNFDDQGRHYDSTMKLRDWWSADDTKRFQAYAQRLSAQFSTLEILPGARVNGAATLGENIADLGGLTIALQAYHLSLHGQPAPVIDGFTGDQRVFLGWAQGWRSKWRDDALRRLIATDVHSPDIARVNGVMRNMDEWYTAFHIMPGDALYLPPEQRVHVW